MKESFYPNYLKMTHDQYLQNLAEAFGAGAKASVITMLRDMTSNKAFADKLEDYLTEKQEEIK